MSEAAGSEGATPGNFRSAVRASAAVQPQPMGSGDPAAAMTHQPAQVAEPMNAEVIPESSTLPDGEPQESVDPWEAPLHGLTTKQVVEALKAGTLPEELAKALKRKVKLPVGRDPQTGQFRHEEVELTIDQLERGNMRERDYTNGKREIAKLRTQAQEAIEAPSRLFDSWKADQSGSALEQHLLEMGLSQHIEQILERRAKEYVADQKLSPEARHWKAEARKAKEEAARFAREQANRPQQQPDNSQAMEHAVSLTKNALQAVGVPYAPTSARYFGEALAAVWDQGMDLTADMVATAAESARQQLMADRGELDPRAPAVQPPAALQGRPAPGPVGKVVAPQGNGSGTVADFRKDMAALRQRR